MTSLSIRRPARLAACLLVALFARPAFSEYVVNQIDYVDPATGAVANFTQVWSSNKHANTLGLASFDGGATQFGFVYDPASGDYQRVLLPPGYDGITTFAFPLGINDAGVMTGNTLEADGSARGFVLRNGVYAFFSRLRPEWANTFGRTIGNPTPAHPGGLVVGHVDDGLFETLQSVQGFVYDPLTSAFATINNVDSFFTIAHGQNASGQIVGSIIADGSSLAEGNWAFLFRPNVGTDPLQGGNVSYFRVNDLPTQARGINDHGVIAGTVESPTADFVRNDAYVGNAATGFQIISAPSDSSSCPDVGPRGLFSEHLSNAGQVFGIYVDNACNVHGFIATPASLPTATTVTGAHQFSVDVAADAPVFISAPTSTGYLYTTGRRDPAFASVRLPLGFGDNKFVLIAGLRAFAVNAGQLFDFRAHGFERGVRAFAVACIDPAARLHPVNSLAFPTELTFVGAGTFSGVQQPFPDLTARGFPPPSSAECRQSLLSLR